jgi:hypothetical protein
MNGAAPMTAFGLIAVDLSVRSAMDCLTPWLNSFWQSLEDAGAAVALTAIASAVDPVTVIQGIEQSLPRNHHTDIQEKFC